MTTRDPVATPTIRPATPADADVIGSVHTRTWQVAYRRQLPDELLDGLSAEGRAAFWRARLTAGDPDKPVLVADDGDEVVGFVAVGPSRDAAAPPGVAEIEAIYVAPERWGRGVGGVLLAAAEELLVARGYEAATLWVLETNLPTRRFYERRGWAVDGSRRTEVLGGAEVEQVRYGCALHREGAPGPR